MRTINWCRLMQPEGLDRDSGCEGGETYFMRLYLLYIPRCSLGDLPIKISHNPSTLLDSLVLLHVKSRSQDCSFFIFIFNNHYSYGTVALNTFWGIPFAFSENLKDYSLQEKWEIYSILQQKLNLVNGHWRIQSVTDKAMRDGIV